MTLRDWSLRTKQLASFGLVLLIMSAVHFYTIHNMRAIRVEVDEVAQNWLPRALAISDVSVSTSRLRINQLQQTLASDAEARHQLTATSIELIDQINANLDAYRELRETAVRRDRLAAEERRHYGAYDTAWEEYQDLSFVFYQMLADDEVDGAVELLLGDGQTVFQRLHESLESLVTVNRLESLQAANRAAETFRSARGISTMLLLATVVLSVLIAVALVHKITVPITALERASGEVARGDLDVRIQVESGDEIGRLADSFNQMTDALRQATQEREKQAGQLRVQNQELAAAMRDLEDTQQQLLLREKMASLGDLVAGVTHELNSPIGAADSGVDVARRCADRLEEALQAMSAPTTVEQERLHRSLRILHESLDNCQTAMERISSIVDSLRNFARLDEAEYQRVDVHEGIESTLTLMHAELLGEINVERRYGEVPEIECYPGQLNQVYRIVLKNAAAAVKGNGTIAIETQMLNDEVHIRFIDDGGGIPPERLRRLFDFGFNTGGSRVRLSAGLPTAYNIMQRHGGDIRIDSNPGSGTTVHLVLPVHAA